MTPRAIVLFSGGQDSTTCLYQAIEDLGAENVLAVSLLYGSKHGIIEFEQAKKIAKLAEVRHRAIDIRGVFHGCSSALIDTSRAITADGGLRDVHAPLGLPTSYVPARNLILLSIAASVAVDDEARRIYTGVCQTDYSGYPDCRDAFIRSLEDTVNLGVPSSAMPIRILTPLMFKTKADTVRLAEDLEGCWDALALSHTCYTGVHPGCGMCPACELRAKGFAEAGVEDPLFDAGYRKEVEERVA